MGRPLDLGFLEVGGWHCGEKAVVLLASEEQAHTVNIYIFLL